jgi:eukaryotic-like serine/threonine-protein kinase
VIPLGIAVLIGGVGYFGYRSILDSFRQGLREQMQTLLDADKEALRIWVDSKCRIADMIASRPAVAEAATRVVAMGENATPEALRGSEHAEKLVSALAEELERGGFEGFVLMDKGGRILASEVKSAIGTRVPGEQVARLGGVLDGKATLLKPFAPAVDQAFGSPVGPPQALMFFATPLRGVAGAPAPAVLAFRVPIAEDFSRILTIARLGDTGETYAFDHEGRLLSESRFENHLRGVGLLAPGKKSTLNVEIRDPGGNLLEGHQPDRPLGARPLTKMAAIAVTGAPGIDVDGYRDYRGVPVIGAWEWFPDLDFGVTHEVDVAEAYEPLRLLSRAFWTLFGAAALAALVLSVGSVVIDRLHRTVSDVKQLGQYTLVEKIGEGAMGKVYRATHAMLRRPTAVKLLETREPGALGRFEREVQLTSQLSHPNTIAIYDYGRTPEGIFYYAMEYLEGIDLADLIRLEGALPPARIVHILRQICGSLAEAHEQGFVHRDIKPSNIMLTMRGGEPDVVKVLDFGLVKSLRQERQTLLTSMGVVFGTPGFIPPETLRNDGVFDARGDLYAVGAVAYELVTGLALFEHTTAFEICRKHLEIDPVPPSVRLGRPLPPILQAVIMRCLAKDPNERPQSARELRELLDGCQDVGPWTQAEAREWWAARAEAVAEVKVRVVPDAAGTAKTIPFDRARRSRTLEAEMPGT